MDLFAGVKPVIKQEVARPGRSGTSIGPGQFQREQFPQAAGCFRMRREVVRDHRAGNAVFQQGKYGVQQTMLGNDQAVGIPVVP